MKKLLVLERRVVSIKVFVFLFMVLGQSVEITSSILFNEGMNYLARDKLWKEN